MNTEYEIFALGNYDRIEDTSFTPPLRNDLPLETLYNLYPEERRFTGGLSAYELTTDALVTESRRRSLKNPLPTEEKVIAPLCDIEPPEDPFQIAVIPRPDILEPTQAPAPDEVRDRIMSPGNVWATNPTLAQGAADHPRRNATPWIK